MSEDALLDEIKASIMGMQEQMQSTYTNLESTVLTGKSDDGSVILEVTATWQLKGFNFTRDSFADGRQGFIDRFFQAWADLNKKVGEATQSKTIELLQSMQIPEEIRNISNPAEAKALGSDESTD